MPLPGALVGSSIPTAGWGIRVQGAESLDSALPRRATDAEVISASLQQPELFEEIFGRHFDVIYRHVARRVGPDVAADIASDVFERAFATRQRYKTAFTSARPWLFGITANLLRQHYRKHRRATMAHWRATSRETWKSSDDTDQADRRVDAESMSRNLERGLAKLRTVEREVLLLFAWSDMTYPEIAHALDIPIGTVRSRLARARARLRELMGEDWRIKGDATGEPPTGREGSQ